VSYLDAQRTAHSPPHLKPPQQPNTTLTISETTVPLTIPYLAGNQIISFICDHAQVIRLLLSHSSRPAILLLRRGGRQPTLISNLTFLPPIYAPTSCTITLPVKPCGTRSTIPPIVRYIANRENFSTYPHTQPCPPPSHTGNHHVSNLGNHSRCKANKAQRPTLSPLSTSWE